MATPAWVRSDEAAGRGALLAAALWITAVLAVAWPAIRYPVFASDSTLDSAFFAYAGQLVRGGGIPYVTFWDHKPPLVYFIDAAALTVSGGHVWGLWAATLAALLLAIALAYVALRRAFGQAGAALGVLAFAFSLPLMLGANLTEGYALPLQWASVLLLVSWRPGSARMYACGVALGVLATLAFLLKQTLFGAMASVGIALSIALLGGKRRGEWGRLAMGVITGVAAVAAVLVIYLVRVGALAAFWRESFLYNFAYTGTASWGMRARAALAALTTSTRYMSLVLPAIGWALAVAALARRGRRDPRFAVWVLAAIWLPIELALVSVSGRAYAHYYNALLPPLAFLVALAISALAQRDAVQSTEGLEPAAVRNGFALHNESAVLDASPARDGSLVRDGSSARDASSVRDGWDPRAVLLSSAAAAIVLFAVTETGVRLRDDTIPAMRHRQVGATVAYIDRHTPPGSALLVWGHASDVYFFSHRKPASRFVYPLPLLTPGYGDSARIAGFVDEIRRTAPPLIVDATRSPLPGENLVPALAHFDPRWSYPPDGGTVRWWAMPPAMRSFYDYVARHYALAATVGPWHWQVYARRPVTAGRPATAGHPATAPGKAVEPRIPGA